MGQPITKNDLILMMIRAADSERFGKKLSRGDCFILGKRKLDSSFSETCSLLSCAYFYISMMSSSLMSIRRQT